MSREKSTQNVCVIRGSCHSIEHQMENIALFFSNINKNLINNFYSTFAVFPFFFFRHFMISFFCISFCFELGFSSIVIIFIRFHFFGYRIQFYDTFEKEKMNLLFSFVLSLEKSLAKP